MIGLMSRMTSPSSVVSNRSTPCVAGWWGPKLSVSSSASPSRAPAMLSGSSRSESEIDSSSRRYSETVLIRTALPRDRPSLEPPRHLHLVVGEQHRLAADREVAALRVALVVLGHEDAAEVRMALELHPEHVVDLSLLVVGGGPQVDHRADDRLVGGHARLDREA